MGDQFTKYEFENIVCKISMYLRNTLERKSLTHYITGVGFIIYWFLCENIWNDTEDNNL